MAEKKSSGISNEHDDILRQIQKNLEAVENLPASVFRTSVINVLTHLTEWLLASNIIYQLYHKNEFDDLSDSEKKKVYTAWQSMILARGKLQPGLEAIEQEILAKLQSWIQANE